jgi:hypothetical protein
MNGAHMNSVRWASRTFRSRKREYLKDKISEPEQAAKTKISKTCPET